MSEQQARSRTIAATPQEIFAVLADPAQHQFTEPTEWVRDAYDSAPITGVGQMFGMDMFHDGAGGHYRIDNKVVAFDPDHTIGWQPGQYENGEWGSGGWWWRYDLTPAVTSDAGPQAPRTGGTEVMLTYDWADVDEPTRAQFGGFPVVSTEFLEESLATLDRYVTQQRV